MHRNRFGALQQPSFCFHGETLSRVSLREAEADKVRDALLAAVAKTGLERKAQPEKKRKDANPKA